MNQAPPLRGELIAIGQTLQELRVRLGPSPASGVEPQAVNVLRDLIDQTGALTSLVQRHLIMVGAPPPAIMAGDAGLGSRQESFAGADAYTEAAARNMLFLAVTERQSAYALAAVEFVWDNEGGELPTGASLTEAEVDDLRRRLGASQREPSFGGGVAELAPPSEGEVEVPAEYDSDAPEASEAVLLRAREREIVVHALKREMATATAYAPSEVRDLLGKFEEGE